MPLEWQMPLEGCLSSKLPYRLHASRLFLNGDVNRIVEWQTMKIDTQAMCMSGAPAVWCSFLADTEVSRRPDGLKQVVEPEHEASMALGSKDAPSTKVAVSFNEFSAFAIPKVLRAALESMSVKKPFPL